MFCLFIIFQLLILNTFSTRYFKTILPRTSVVRVKDIWTREAEGCKSSFIKFDLMLRISQASV